MYILAKKFLKASRRHGIRADIKLHQDTGDIYINPNPHAEGIVFNFPRIGITVLKEGDSITIPAGRYSDSENRKVVGSMAIMEGGAVLPDFI